MVGKRKRQRRELSWKRRSIEPVIKPCFVWTFYNDTFIYGGWWLYVKTLRYSWQIERGGHYERLIVPIMTMWPCKLLPFIQNFDQWKEAFAHNYAYPTQKRPKKQGMAIAWAQVSYSGRLLDILKTPPQEG